MKERLQKLLSEYGVASRREAERMIAAGRVKVNGKIATVGQSADPETDKIEADGRRVDKQPPKTYVMLNKPRGYVTTMDDERGRKKVTDLLDGLNNRVYPVGRLDMNSEGMLILTNDGEFANLLTHPSHEIEKEYHASVSGDVRGAMKLLSSGMEIDGYQTAPARIRIVKQEEDSAVLSIIIHEGRNRQVRKMCEEANLEVKRLKRIAIGQLTLQGLPPGKWRLLTEAEVNYLYAGSKG